MSKKLFNLGTPTAHGWYNAAVRTADDTDHHITVTLYWNGTDWMKGEQYSKSPLSKYEEGDSVVGYAALPEFDAESFDTEEMCNLNVTNALKKRVCESKRSCLRVPDISGDPVTYTILKPMSNEHEGKFFVVMEDAWGNVDGEIAELSEMTEKISMEDLNMIEEYFKRK